MSVRAWKNVRDLIAAFLAGVWVAGLLVGAVLSRFKWGDDEDDGDDDALDPEDAPSEAERILKRAREIVPSR